MARIAKARVVEAKSIRDRKSQIRGRGFPKKQKVRWRSEAELARTRGGL
jgi:hypothetical protein